MKTVKLIIAAVCLIFSGTTQAQISVTVGVPPPWAPAEATGVRFYYLPDIQVYYDANSASYIYFYNGHWRHSTYLPAAYGNYDLYGGYKVLLSDYHGERPYERFDNDRRAYPKGYNHGHFQKTYHERPGKESERHDEHRDHGHDHDGHGDNNEHDRGKR